jgi:hypothetical protein
LQKEGTGGERRSKDRVILSITLQIRQTNNFFQYRRTRGLTNNFFQYRRTRGLKTLENNKFPTTHPIFLLIKEITTIRIPKIKLADVVHCGIHNSYMKATCKLSKSKIPRVTFSTLIL